MNAHVLVVVATVLLLSTAVVGQSTPPSLANFSPEQQKNATQFVNQRCFANANGIVAQIQNGFATEVPYTVVLQCQGTGNATFQVTIAPFTVSEPFLIQPATGEVANRVCSLLLTGVDPHDASALPTPITFQNFTTTCGAVQVRNRDFDEDVDDDCHFADAPCEYNKGSWYYGFFPTLIHAFIITAVVLIPFGIFASIANRSLENFLIGAGSTRGDYVDQLDAAVEKWKRADTTHPAHVGRNLHGGGKATGRCSTRDHSYYESDEDNDDTLVLELEDQGMVSMSVMDGGKHLYRDSSDDDDDEEGGIIHHRGGNLQHF